MQLFVLHHDPRVAAWLLDDKRVVKMAVETAQILSSALALTGRPGFYKTTHVNHPVVRWVAADSCNFSWVVRYLQAVLAEYTARYGRVHASARHLAALQDYVVAADPASFFNLAANRELGVDFTALPDTVAAYNKYLAARWATDKRPPTWYKQQLGVTNENQ